VKRRGFLKALGALAAAPAVKAVAALDSERVMPLDGDDELEVHSPPIARKLNERARIAWEREWEVHNFWIHPGDMDELFGGPTDRVGRVVHRFVCDYGDFEVQVNAFCPRGEVMVCRKGGIS
jgi:hypothetical protein